MTDTDALKEYLGDIEEYIFENFCELSFEDNRHPKDRIDSPDEIQAELISVSFGESREKSRSDDTVLFEIAAKMIVAPILSFNNQDMSYEEEGERVYLESNSYKVNQQECVIPLEVELVTEKYEDGEEEVSVNIQFTEDCLSLHW